MNRKQIGYATERGRENNDCPLVDHDDQRTKLP